MKKVLVKSETIINDNGYHIIDADGNVIKPTQKAVSYMQVDIIGNLHDNPELLEVEE